MLKIGIGVVGPVCRSVDTTKCKGRYEPIWEMGTMGPFPILVVILHLVITHHVEHNGPSSSLTLSIHAVLSSSDNVSEC